MRRDEASGQPLEGTTLLYDSEGTRFTRVRVGDGPVRPLGGPSPEIASLVDYEEFCGVNQR